jgi:quinol monooxygenase YgiN
VGLVAEALLCAMVGGGKYGAGGALLPLVAAVITGIFLGRWSSTYNSRSSTNAFVLLVNLQFTSLEHRTTFLKLIEPLCEDVRANELSKGTTLSYKVAISDKDPLMVIVLERYSDRENGYLSVHKEGKAFLSFRDELKGMQDRNEVTIKGESYLETDLGYV